MNRPWKVWSVFALCLTVVLVAMAWISAQALRLERSEGELREVEESIRLALWRMDSSLAPLIVGESSRPYFSYTAFYPAERTYNKMFNEIESGQVLVPSDLLIQDVPHIRLHFQFRPDGTLTSPQVPAGNMRDRAESDYTTSRKIQSAGELLARLQSRVTRERLDAALPAEAPRPEIPLVVTEGPAQEATREQAQLQQGSSLQRFKNSKEWAARSNTYRNIAAQQAEQQLNLACNFMPASEAVSVGVLSPLWIEDLLLLARRVTVKGQEYLQGCWLDWDGIRATLVGEIGDLLPRADLVPVRDGDGERPTQVLAALPIRLVAGPLAQPLASLPASAWLPHLIAWCCVLMAAAAVAILLRGALSLSERRGAFVSAVTHELRTPLTTFRLYTEMLVQNMVTDEKKRLRYLETLQNEADRLGHMVENVLAYACLENGRKVRKGVQVPIRKFLDRVTERLSDRAEQAGMQLEVESSDREAAVVVDVSAAEQILLNLVDNACKYAASAEDRVIRLRASRVDHVAIFRVEDHGPGISPEDARRLFKPFSKSACQAAKSAPGVGLGLALSRCLARDMGGDLRLEEGNNAGACFVLTLPAA